MITCGLKLTHDGAVALYDGNELVFSVEVEKIANSPRYSEVDNLDTVLQLLADFGYSPSDVDHWVIDGWDGKVNGETGVRNGLHGPVTLQLAPYREPDGGGDLLCPAPPKPFRIGDLQTEYHSYVHLAGHLASAYCTSRFAAAGEASLVLVWDGGCFPRLYDVSSGGSVKAGGEVFPLIGHAYAMGAHHFGPYRRENESESVDDLSVAGKLMAYIALGEVRTALVEILAEEYQKHFASDTAEVARFRQDVGGWGSNAELSHPYVHAFYRAVRQRVEVLGYADEDVLASLHQFLEDLLVERVVEKVREWKGDGPWNLCFVGGCALNIKWNSALRAHPMFRDVWVPPFPNDSGSAIGTAAAHLMATSGVQAIKWTPRLGPGVRASEAAPGWSARSCTPEDLAQVLHETGDPVVVVHGRAELGPRALGNRSILAAATDPKMKDRLNEIKGREAFRPVAPICLVDHAPAIFAPGTPDPHMLFDHDVRPDWVERIPAILHLDGTARLQTVGPEDDPTLEAVLRAYHELSDVPVLCNTSANYNGSGFFPDVASVMEWGKVDRIWSDGMLFQRS
ncbi:nodulation protein U [Streptomyces sp. NBC_01456]|uniref:carbamoyltransferase N-terminal domain-containing protein n=1 Tax=unclassified Streptomyces TaxID=2593676 RepID=UPI002E382242|nr:MULTISPECIES: carbamoyltransferase N-terminal domain-containing protein [unclassified Streptomyces]